LLGVGTFSESQKVDGVVGGFQSGYNYQFGQWVWGFETDIQASGQKGGSTLQISALPVTTLTTDHKLTWFGTSRSRLGVLWSPNVLLYGTAGVAYGQVKDTATITAPGASVTGTFKDVKAGWTAGAGVEGIIGGGWTAKLEYLYIDLGKTEQTLATPALGQVISETRRFTDNIVRFPNRGPLASASGLSAMRARQATPGAFVLCMRLGWMNSSSVLSYCDNATAA
jgi:outer membrane immunogenic protein